MDPDIDYKLFVKAACIKSRVSSTLITVQYTTWFPHTQYYRSTSPCCHRTNRGTRGSSDTQQPGIMRIV